MTLRVLFSARAGKWPIFEPDLTAAFAASGLSVDLRTEFSDPAEVDYIVYAPGGPVSDFRPFTRTRAVFSLWAGVESIVDNPTLTQPLTRMVDSGLREGMVEWVTGQVLRHHLDTDAMVAGQDGVWRHTPPPLARDRRVGILGYGELGRACAEELARLNFDVAGWSRVAKPDAAVTVLSGPEGLQPLMARSEILVTLLPLTAATENIVNATSLAALPRGAIVINPGRGALIDDAALLAALDGGHVGHATLDVFREEPLPPAHPYWAHPRVTVTSHIASATRPRTAALVIADNIRRSEAGEPLRFVVDRARGY